MMMGLVLGVLFVTPIVLFYVFVVRWLDRFEPEPWYMIAFALLWGALFATLGGGMASGVVEKAMASLLGLGRGSAELHALGATVVAPVFEEAFKAVGLGLIALVSFLGLRALYGALDGAVYGGIVGLGFTLTEDILYVANQYDAEGLGGFVGLLFLRTVVLGLSHCTFTACTGLGIGIASEARSRSLKVAAPALGFAAAVGLHALHNALPTFFRDAGLVLMILESWMIDALFFLLVAALVVRDRRTVIRELLEEVDVLLGRDELRLVSSYMALARANARVALTFGLAAYWPRRRKQLALVELAFLKHRRRRGERSSWMDRREAELRAQILHAARAGVVLAA